MILKLIFKQETILPVIYYTESLQIIPRIELGNIHVPSEHYYQHRLTLFLLEEVPCE